MSDFLKRQNKTIVIWNSIIIIFGILLCALRGTALNVLERIISSIFIIYGIVSLVLYFFTPIFVRDSQKLIEGIVFLIFGLVLNCFSTLFVFGIGIMLIFEGLKEVSYSLELKKINDEKWWLDFASGITIFALGLIVVILCNTTIASNIVSLLLGISIIIDGATNIILVSTLKRDFTSVRKFVQETDEGFTDYKID